MNVSVERAVDALWEVGAYAVSLFKRGDYRVEKHVTEGPVVNGQIRPDLVDELYPAARVAVQTGECAIYDGDARRVSRRIVKGS